MGLLMGQPCAVSIFPESPGSCPKAGPASGLRAKHPGINGSSYPVDDIHGFQDIHRVSSCIAEAAPVGLQPKRDNEELEI
jgi:hypothetical protein